MERSNLGGPREFPDYHELVASRDYGEWGGSFISPDE